MGRGGSQQVVQAQQAHASEVSLGVAALEADFTPLFRDATGSRVAGVYSSGRRVRGSMNRAQRHDVVDGFLHFVRVDAERRLQQLESAGAEENRKMAETARRGRGFDLAAARKLPGDELEAPPQTFTVEEHEELGHHPGEDNTGGALIDL
ncbi:hypothetical protein EYF80_027802 [Liparis tanakae]|uniref:Uncharacterized protein n=1 Tax=Liparis tanakae TaxID=230148 RepID=A0A4Z2H7S2_9TELE|nr:hypothetical protein EYF80_027802 [Liparis tanakae]